MHSDTYSKASTNQTSVCLSFNSRLTETCLPWMSTFFSFPLYFLLTFQLALLIASYSDLTIRYFCLFSLLKSNTALPLPPPPAFLKLTVGDAMPDLPFILRLDDYSS